MTTSPHCTDGLTVEAARLDRLEREPNLGVIVSLVGSTISSRRDPS
jgi:hypothetical protein